MDFITIAVLAGTLLLLLVLGVPVAFALGLAGIAAIWTEGPQFLIQLPLTLIKSFSDVILIALPLFVLMGEILYRGKVGQQLFDMANVWLGRTRGGTGMAAVFAFTFFAAIVGSSMASVLSIGKIAIPEMQRRGYSKKLSYGLTAVGGSLGILIPPSIPLIIYASLTDTSPGKLFMAGVLPGLFVALLLVVWCAWKSPRTQINDPFSLKLALLKTIQSLPDLMLPIVVLGGIYLGVYTPTEAAAVGVIYAIFLTMVVRRTIKLRDLPSILKESLKSNAMLLTIILGALLFGSALTLIGLPQMLSSATQNAGLPQWGVLLMFFLIWLVMGSFLEVISIILITVPVFFPIAVAAGVDPIWFGIFMVINMEISVITPPVGMNLFAIKSILPAESLGAITKAAVPSLVILLIGLLAMWLFPVMALMLAT
ncbi:TRAP transporter large permease [Rhodoferax ferrireducens]|uniref:TRAP transporter large permease n=1 Tax=Rhodoferax ferrireducens TaxID=192843 RepID=UPI003BB57F43